MKTDFLIIAIRQQLGKTTIESLIIGDSVIKPLESIRNLGSWFDAHMRMNVHIGKICSKAFRGLYNIRQIRKLLTLQSTKTLIHAFVSSLLDHCNRHFYLVCLNINLIVYKKFRIPRLESFFRLRNLVISHSPLSTYIGFQYRSEFSLNCSFLFTSHYTTKVHPTLKIFYPRNQLLIMLFARLHNLFCSFQKSTALHLGIGPLLMLHLFYGTRCHKL